MQIYSVAILENPVAGSGKSSRISEQLAKELSARQIPYTIFTDYWPGDFENFSDIWLIGGDGTINYFINHYPDCNKPLALFKGGTGNDFAWKLYGDQCLEDQLQQVLHSTPKWIDAGKFNDTLFINCLGVGFDGEIIRSMKAIRILGGHLGYLLAVVLKIFSFREYAFKISTETETWKEHFLLVMVVNSSRAGGGFFVAPDAKINDGQLDMVLCRKLPVLKRLKYLPIIQKGKHLHLPFVIHRLGKKFSILAEFKMAIQADGELFRY
jgi:diacylglycerol kinase (ATP)